MAEKLKYNKHNIRTLTDDKGHIVCIFCKIHFSFVNHCALMIIMAIGSIF